MKRVVVVGAGLAGLVTATALARDGFDVTCATFGVGGLPLSPGVVECWVEGVSVAGGVPGGDVRSSAGVLRRRTTLVGAWPDGHRRASRRSSQSYAGAPPAGDRSRPLCEMCVDAIPQPTPSIGRDNGRSAAQRGSGVMSAITRLPSGYPYAAIGPAAVRRGVELLLELAGPELLTGDPDGGVVLLTALGLWRPTCLYPPSMANAVGADNMVIVGLRRLKDFQPQLIAGNLGGRAAMVDVVPHAGEVDSSPMVFARFFDTDAGRRALVEALRPVVEPGYVLGLPAVLGLDDATAWRKVQDALACAVFEIPMGPPSVPGWRLNNALVRAAQDAGVRFRRGVKAVGVAQENGRATGVVLTSAGHPTTLAADAVVLATGGLKSGGVVMDDHQQFNEPVMNLPLANVPEVPFVSDVFAPQPAYLVGVRVDESMHPLDDDGNIVCGNLHAVGGLLGGSDRSRELTSGGIDVGSAVAAAEAVGQEMA